MNPIPTSSLQARIQPLALRQASAQALAAGGQTATQSATASSGQAAWSECNTPGYCQDSRPITVFGQEIMDLGPNYGGLGCGSRGSTAVPDSIGPWNMRPACDFHDNCSTALTDHVDQSLAQVAQCQIGFAQALYQSGPATWWGRLGGAVLAGIYTPVVATVAGAQWVGSRVADAGQAVGNFFSGAWDWMFG